jgi:hypothetical protein
MESRWVAQKMAPASDHQLPRQQFRSGHLDPTQLMATRCIAVTNWTGMTSSAVDVV